MRLTRRFRKFRRKTIKKGGKFLLDAASRVYVWQSLIGNQPVFEKTIFPWTADFEANWRKIRAELDQVMANRDTLPSFHEISRGQKRISRDDNWKTFIFYGLGIRVDANCQRCPETARLLRQVPNLENAWFSILAPGYHIPPHKGPSNGIIRIHLGLIIPSDRDNCRIRVADQILHWDEGKCIVFDDYYEHEVWNDTDEQRVVLFFDVDRPMRPPGRWLNRLLIGIAKRTSFVRDAHTKALNWDTTVSAAGPRPPKPGQSGDTVE